MTTTQVWDPFVRVFHWTLALGIALNGLIVDDDSKLHIQIGYAVLGLVLLRIAWGFVGTPHARFVDFPPDLDASMGQLQDMALGRIRHHAGHSPLGALMIYNLLVTVLLLGLTGYMMTTSRFWGVDWVEETHELLAGWLGVSVLVHVAAVILESRRTGVNLPRAMVTGRKTLPDKDRKPT
ncbi:cytochrome b/b6 domain-containing protein [Thalassovita sp.]|uniref:cytochrome b/b6 domain-containing protein n=1 Tax=Thalassovita sp. TaxID=1979401 RepID=UPI0029DE8095|nr:cytochrome b/b6 domain-containing protein [Thalassovita sp.]